MPEGGAHKPLSEREHQLIELASNGFTDSAIAHRLGISEATVATYWGRIRMKYGPLPRPELIAHAVREQYEDEIESLKKENHALVRSLRQSGGKAASNQDFFREVLDSAADAVIVVDQDGTIDWVNSTTAEVFGYEKSEIVGKHISVLIPDRFRTIHKQHLASFFSDPDRKAMADHTTTYALTKDTDEIPVAATLSPVETDGQALAVCVVRPLSPVAARRIASKG